MHARICTTCTLHHTYYDSKHLCQMLFCIEHQLLHAMLFTLLLPGCSVCSALLKRFASLRNPFLSLAPMNSTACEASMKISGIAVHSPAYCL